jgi:PBP1b-binding outer membrane lipoprotein LpoB
MRRAVATVAVLALVLSGCGAAESSNQPNLNDRQQQVAEVVDRLADAGRRGDAERICDDILAKRLVDELKSAGGDCLTEMDRAIKDASDYDLQVRSVKITGNSATAQVRQGDDGETATFSFVREGGAWRASALGA